MKTLVATTTLFAAGFALLSTSTGHSDALVKFSVSPKAVTAVDPGCQKTFTVAMADRAARAVYAGSKKVTMDERRMLGRIEKCLRNPNAHDYVNWFYHHQRRQWHQRREAAAQQSVTITSSFSYAVASWYDLHGTGACGVGDVQSGYAFASLILPCGAQIEICSSGCAVATMVDHGPYVAGRTFDLNYNLRNAINCDGICNVKWRRIN